MKRVFLPVLILIFGTMGCASSQKKADAPQTPAQKSDSATQTTATGTKMSEAPRKRRKKAAATAAAMSCALNSDERKAEIRAKGTGCEVEYTKLGESKVIASAAEGTQHCQDVVDKIKKNLASAGFKCE